jgi:hypothetical protein
MSYTNSTPNYELPQWIGTDKPTFLGDFNNAFDKIDTQMKANADASTAATATANSAAATATNANTNAMTALNTANNAASQAASATSAAASATSTANTASTDAAAALRASAANTIENLAPAYDPTLTYAVGDLVTFIDDQNSGKLYKCIVPVTSPMVFNVNYWDDVTTSEVYVQQSNGVVATATGDGVKTFAAIAAELMTSIVEYNMDKEYLLVTKTPLHDQTDIYHARRVTADSAIFDATFIGSNQFSMRELVIGSTSAYRSVVSTVGSYEWGFTDNTNNVVPSGTVYTISELSTI